MTQVCQSGLPCAMRSGKLKASYPLQKNQHQPLPHLRLVTHHSGIPALSCVTLGPLLCHMSLWDPFGKLPLAHLDHQMLMKTVFSS